MLNNVDASVFTGSNSVQLLPLVSAEWNQNLFNPPYITIAGTGSKESVTANSTYTSITDANKHPNFSTYSFTTSGGTGSVSYAVNSPTGSSAAYKVITYVKTNKAIPLMLNAYGKANSHQYGSVVADANNYGWTKLEFIMGGQSKNDTITSNITINIVANVYSNSSDDYTIYYTLPEVYATSYSDYQYSSLWPTDSAVNFFRPGESYINCGNSNITLPNNFRQINNINLNSGQSAYAPVSSIIENPQYFFVTQYVPYLKNILPSDIATYKYFVSDNVDTPSFTTKYMQSITSNKIVLKFNTLMTIPNISIYLNGSQTPTYTGNCPSNGVLILYYNNGSWSTSKWSTMPQFNDSGTLSISTTINQITVVQNSKTVNSSFPAPDTKSPQSLSYTQDVGRMQLIEVSPRLEVDLTDYVQDVSITKQLDSKSTVVPLSTMNPNDATVTLSGVPAYTSNGPVPIFSNQSNNNSSILSKMLGKNIKIYVNWQLLSYSSLNNINSTTTYIPGGIFYCDSWDETDISTIRIQSYDTIRYLQTLPVPDYVSNFKTVFEIISNLLERAGYSDYDMDSLYAVTNDPANPLDISYYYANSQDKTIAAALSELFLAYQIGAYIDEYGVMRFLSLSKILSIDSTQASLSLDDSNVYQDGYGVSNIGKVGKISLRYQEPKIKQTLSLQNATDPTQKKSPSFIYTTSNEQVWISNTTDGIGFNYLSQTMDEASNYFYYNVNDLLDIFHTFNLNTNGYATIENEIVSFMYKEYSISNGTATRIVAVKNDLELAAAVDKFVKENVTSGLTITTGLETSAPAPSNVNIVPTGRIVDVQRGLFGTAPSTHNILSGDLSSKNLSAKDATVLTSNSSAASIYSYLPTNSSANQKPIKVISCSPPIGSKTLIYPTSDLDLGYHTYSTKFHTNDYNLFSCGLFFNMQAQATTIDGAFFVELTKSYTGDTVITVTDPITMQDTTQTTKNYQWIISIYQQNGSTANIISWADVTGMMNNINNNFEKVLVKQSTGDLKYLNAVDAAYQLKVIHYDSDGSDGEISGKIINVFINNAEVVGWQIPEVSSNTLSNGWKQTATNTTTGVRQLPSIGSAGTFTGTRFGFYTTTTPAPINNLVFNRGYAMTTQVVSGYVREIYATQDILINRSNNYWYQTSEFLNGLVQKQNIFNKYLSYMMQTQPTISGINVYDVQYQLPAATNVDILPVEYYQLYYPDSAPARNDYRQEMVVDEYSLAYSTPLNTGFRARFAIANNSPFLVWTHKTPDDLNQISIQLVLWTHEIVAQSDPAIIEKVINKNNITEVAQIDSQWVQSAEAGQKMISLISNAIDGFSKDTTLKIFGNPLIQLGDVINLTYPLTGINQKLFVVQAVKHSFNNGLETDLTLNAIGTGIQY